MVYRNIHFKTISYWYILTPFDTFLPSFLYISNFFICDEFIKTFYKLHILFNIFLFSHLKTLLALFSHKAKHSILVAILKDLPKITSKI